MSSRLLLPGLLAALGVALSLALGRAAMRDADGDAAAGTHAGAAAAHSGPIAAARVVCVGGALTESVCALGAGATLVAVDDGSTFPPSVRDLPRLGYQRALSAEGLLSQRPTLVLASPEAGPPAVLAQWRDAGIDVRVIDAEHTPAGAEALITAVAHALGRDAEGAALAARLRADVARAQASLAALLRAGRAPPRVLCLYARARGTLHACGEGSAMDAMVALAGGVNALAGLHGSVPLGGEAAVAAAPDVILMPRGSAELSGGSSAVLEEASLALTPAGRAGRVVVMDDLLLSGFGPRTGQALEQLVRELHP